MLGGLFKILLAWLNTTLLNKTTASSAVGSGSVIFIMFAQLNEKIKGVDQKVNSNMVSISQQVDKKKSEVIDYVDHKNEIVLKDVESVIKILNRVEHKVDVLDNRLFDSKTQRSK